MVGEQRERTVPISPSLRLSMAASAAPSRSLRERGREGRQGGGQGRGEGGREDREEEREMEEGGGEWYDRESEGRKRAGEMGNRMKTM